MAETLVSDVIVPEVFVPYVIERTAELSRIFQSGIVNQDPEFAMRAAAGGQTVNMPFWQDLSGDDQVLSDSGALTTKKIAASADIAAIHNRGDAWQTNDLAGLLAGDDPMAAIGDLVAAYWARKSQGHLVNTLSGIFGAATMANLELDICVDPGPGTPDATNTLNGDTFIDAKQLLGDAKDKLVAIVMHSAVEADLLKQDLIDYIPQSEGKEMLKTFQGLEVIVDDGVPTETVDSKTVYHTFVFGRGAVAMGVARVNEAPIEGGHGTWEVEFARNALAGQNILINRRRFILHPRGIKWTSASVAGLSPTNAEMATATNWVRVYEEKNIRIVKIRHNITP